jgi:hypothetical protein
MSLQVLLRKVVGPQDCTTVAGSGHRPAPDSLLVVEVVAAVVHVPWSVAVAEAKFDSAVAGQLLQTRRVLAVVVEAGHVALLAWPHMNLYCIRPWSVAVVDSIAGLGPGSANASSTDSGSAQAETDILAQMCQSHLDYSLQHDSAYLHTLVVEELLAAAAVAAPRSLLYCQVSDSPVAAHNSASCVLALYRFQLCFLCDSDVVGLNRSTGRSCRRRVCEPKAVRLYYQGRASDA